jgi:hypothetical protein
MNAEFLIAVNNLKDAFNALHDVYDKPHNDLLGSEDYPFELSFDEMARNVQTWFETCVESMDANFEDILSGYGQSKRFPVKMNDNEQPIKDLLFAYLNKDPVTPHDFEIVAIQSALPIVKGKVDDALFKRYEDLINAYI